MKALNREKILSLLLTFPLLSRVELAKRASVSPAVVSNVIKECLTAGIVREESEGPSRGGRKPILLSFVPEESFVVGLIPGNETEFAVADLASRIVFREKITGKTYPTPGELSGFLQSVLKEFFREKGISWSQLVSVGIGIPGVYDPELDRIHKMGKISGLLAWEGAQIRDIFSQKFSCPILVFDKVVAIAFGEGILRSTELDINLVYLHLGRGVGAGLVLGGRIYRGSQGAAGEVGYMIGRSDQRNDFPISLHEMPALEKEMSLNSILMRYRELRGHDAVHQGTVFYGDREAINLQHSYQTGDVFCHNLLEPVFQRAEELAVNITAILNPDRIVLGGELTELFSETLFRRINDRLQRSVLFPPPVEPVTFGKDEEITCTLFFAIDDYFQQLTGGYRGLTAPFLARYCGNDHIHV